jgi:transposase
MRHVGFDRYIGGVAMRKLEINTPMAVHTALRQEVARSPQSRYLHRLYCLTLVGAGWNCHEVANIFGDHPRSVERWVRTYQQRGIEGLKEKPHGGRHSILSNAQLRELETALKSSPAEQGYGADAWNSGLLRLEILRRFGLTFSGRHCQRLVSVLQKALTREQVQGR